MRLQFGYGRRVNESPLASGGQPDHHLLTVTGPGALRSTRRAEASFREIAMITGMHAIIYSRDAVADRAFFRDVLGFPSVDAGDGC
jgi:hypothetical protein